MKHPGIVQFLTAGRMGKEYVLVLELATEGSLNAFLSRTVCDWRHAVKLAQTLSEGLAYLHTDLQNHGVYKPVVAHGDFSSNNVLVRSDGSCALCDFGCSTILQNFRICQTLEVQRDIAKGTFQRGTLRYMAPEILDGCVNPSSGHSFLQADVYSLGLLLWELLMRCSDLFKDSPIPEHMLPYEIELGHSPTHQDLVTFVSEKGLRPTIPHLWGNISQGWSLREILEDCWDHDEDARLTAQCAANRLASLPSELY
ncbi:hypothetical protein PHYPO_G00199800 [Pangasianodon hypophthalmus]|uniref:receptor protein serine/threonine kinase n=1 Tax=Pangasianodon hypophthalmus TaxID=310915 RepID=A0A5N5PJD0_PANHP|nr:hypothetical protein PHYPO_G00199800 [Pangasianodon hypophthalmus]